MQHFGRRTKKDDEKLLHVEGKYKIGPEDGRFRFELIFSASIESYCGLKLPIKSLREIFYAKSLLHLIVSSIVIL